jgi:hypothetical protein
VTAFLSLLPIKLDQLFLETRRRDGANAELTEVSRGCRSDYLVRFRVARMVTITRKQRNRHEKDDSIDFCFSFPSNVQINAIDCVFVHLHFKGGFCLRKI